VSLRNLPQVHLLEAGQLNTYDVLNADDVVFTQAALTEFVSGRQGEGSGVAKPDLRTPDVPGAIPSIEPAEGTTDLDVEPATGSGATAATGDAPATTPGRRVPTEDVTTPAEAARADVTADDTTEEQA
jgi:large subunit ribosomal protein L4